MEQHKEEIGTRQDLALYRIQTAKSDLKSARILLAAEVPGEEFRMDGWKKSAIALTFKQRSETCCKKIIVQFLNPSAYIVKTVSSEGFL